MPARIQTAKTKAGTTAKATKGKSATAVRGKAAPGNGHGTKLVIVESPSKVRTIAGYLGQGYVVESSVGHIRDMPDSAAEIPAKYRASRGPGSASTWTTTSSRCSSCTATSASRSPSSRACSRTPTNSCSPPMKTARARPSPGTCWRSSSPRCRTAGWSSTRSPRRSSPGPSPTRARWTTAWSTPIRRAGCWTGCTGTKSRPCCGRSAHAQAVRRAGAVGRHPAGGRPGAGADRVPPGRLLRPRGRVRDQGPRQAEHPRADSLHREPGHRGRPPGRPGPRLHLGRRAAHQDHRCPAPGRRSRGRPGAAARRATLRGRQRGAQAVPALAVRAVPHHHAAAGGLAQARLLRQAHDVRSRSGCTRTATSPICAPTR